MNSQQKEVLLTCLGCCTILMLCLVGGALLIGYRIKHQNDEPSCQLCLEILDRSSFDRQHLPLGLAVTNDAVGPCLNGKVTGESPLNLAACYGDVEAVRALLAAGADPNQLSRSGDDSPLMSMAGNVTAETASRYREWFDLLTQHGADVNLRSEDYKMTALHYAARSDYPEPIGWLVAHGADVNARNRIGRTPLHWADHPNTIMVLVELGANCNAKDNDGKTPFDLADDPKARATFLAACR